MSQTLLIELGTEELPPKALQKLSLAFTKSISQSLLDSHLIDNQAEIESFASPRRLAVMIKSVANKQDDYSQRRKGPAVRAAYDANGKPTQAALGFAKSCGVDINQLGTEKSDKGEWLIFEQSVRGKSITECAQAALDTAITQLPIPKRMRWGDKTVEFVRPVHWLLALYGNDVLAINTLNLHASNTTQGHRFHHPDSIEIKHPDEYEAALERAYVVAHYAKRQALISQQCHRLAETVNGTAVLDADLLTEVTALVEWPVAIIGTFDPAYLDVPREALIASMKDHQKYFYLRAGNNTGDNKGNGDLLPNFITVSNIESSQPETVLKGNERVLHARLADGQFFWEQDKQHTLEDNAPRLENLLFHVKLGSVADKTRRLESIAEQYAVMIKADAVQAKRAAHLCKLDLLSNMVGEFAGLQGIMGRYYAQIEQEDSTVADAIEQHYWPKFSGDHLAESGPAIALALADRMDTLVGIFATGEKPSGDKDPYALRRAALGVLRMMIEKKLDLSLQDMIEVVMKAYAVSPNIKTPPDHNTQAALNQFILDRLRAYYLAQGFEVNAFNAVAETQPARAYDFDQRIRAVSDFFESEKSAATALASSNKRIANILKKNNHEGHDYDATLFQDPAEHALADALSAVSQTANDAFHSQEYAKGLSALAKLEQPVATFFDEVMVMHDDDAIRKNRLGMLGALRRLFLQVADISHLNVDN